MKQDRAKIVWTIPEWNRLIAAAAPLVFGGLSPLDAFRQVQVDVFRTEKWRIRHLYAAADITRGLQQLLGEVARLDSSGAPVATPPKSNGVLPPWMEEKIEREAEAEAARVRTIYEAKLAERIREKLSEPPPPIAAAPAAPAVVPEPVVPKPAPSPIERATRDEATLRQQEQAPRPPKHSSEMRADDRAVNPKVVIVGLWPSVRAEINKEFHEVLDLRFFENNLRDLAVMQRHARNATLVVCFEKVASSICATLRRESKRFEMTHGASKHLLDRLTRFAVEGK